MNKKNKGFTLIEVLATIAIIAVVTLIATVTYTKVRKNLVNKQYKNLKSIIEIAGVRYTSKTGKTNYFVEELIEEGYLDPDDETGNIYDPRDDHSLNCHEVRVVIENTNYEATLGDVSYKGKDGCQMPSPTPDPIWEISLTALIHGTEKNYITAPDDFSKLLKKDSTNVYKNIDIVVDDAGLRWTNKQLDLTAELDPNLPFYVDTTGVKYIWNNEPSSITTSNKHTTSVEVIYQNPYTVEAVMKNNKRYNAEINYYFDQEAPEIKKGSESYLNSDKDTWKKFKYITFDVNEIGVGLYKIYIGKRPCSDMKKDSTMGVKVGNAHTHVQTFKVEIEAGVEGENGEVNVCAIDKLGNVSKGETFKLIKVDITPPHCKKNLKENRSQDVIGEHNKYQYASRTIRQYCYDNNMVNGVLVKGSQCDSSGSNAHRSGDFVYFEKTFSPSVGTAIKGGYITIKDVAGWETKCPVDVYVDRKGPLCSKKTGNTRLGQTKNGGSSATDGATTLGVGSVNNWDQRFRHITQYCYDEHVGCRSDNNPSKSQEWDYNDGEIIRTGTITLYDKVPYCSRKETVTSSNCSGSDWNSSYNNSHYNNKTACTVGVYIDHVAPETVKESGGFVHSENRIRFSCSDPSRNNVAGSGILTFNAKSTTDSGLVTIKPCHSAGDCSASYGPQISNTSGGTLHFKISHSVSNAVGVIINTDTYCEDKAHNTDVHNTDNNNSYSTETAISYTDDNSYIKTNYKGTPIGPCSTGCKLRKYRPALGNTCDQYSYECQCTDSACPSADNAGEGVTCCLGGADPVYGCKTWKTTITPFDGRHDYEVYPGSQGNVSYMNYNGKRYVKPDLNSQDYNDYCNANGCLGGYECLVYNCYPDNPYGNNYRFFTVCGNYTE